MDNKTTTEEFLAHHEEEGFGYLQTTIPSGLTFDEYRRLTRRKRHKHRWARRPR